MCQYVRGLNLVHPVIIIITIIIITIIIIIIIRHVSGLDRLVVASSSSLFKGLASLIRPFGL